jgi:hypothetical protein
LLAVPGTTIRSTQVRDNFLKCLKGGPLPQRRDI